jgi:NAD(P)-dependent dehydrogenase (short-subunit alcohol dehydrogenase family)
MAKAGIIGFTKTAAKELARFGVTVNAISPNAATRMVASVPADRQAELTAQIPLGRFAEPREMAAAVAFLASAEAAYPEAITDLATRISNGSLVARTHLVNGGLDRFHDTFLMLFSGANTGKLLLAL